MIQPFTQRPIQWVSDQGELLQDLPERYTPEFIRELYRHMLRAREMDRKLIPLLRQGRTSFYAQAHGMEATQVGLALACRSGHDWWWLYYRDHPIMLTLGVPMLQIVSQIMGTASDSCKGRQMPHHFCAKEYNVASISSSIASQIPPATGTAMAQKYLGTDEITVCTFGDGATSEGDWHAGVNMAAVSHAPVMFVCENNQWAISTGVADQTASETIHIKARAYGMPGYYVDGNDVIAVLEVMSHVADQIRSGEGPAMVEALTYRVGSHSNADADAEKNYRTREEVAEWTARDPLERIEKLLQNMGHPISEEEKAAMVGEVGDEVAAAIDEAAASGTPDWDLMFQDVYAVQPPHLAEQEAYVRAEQEALA
ncbi:thiamine pyrophosphate-dependent dehydrogenase E1 component subunit alpha [Deinococcus radiophilus]|uniref:2-oxoisovalerate dehydrogenase subunit alpha n=1 Tax=Deinococcus radiophilus TaxID=32062 RepID=A0A431VRC4_9DEIO|nr:thiamine pyrophosphate-dependent dehydrogenase E1 component subunit alpha [Deinococcus radiophilus]RTR25735.1 thiamine pyrophosphate-dependent dehydrogenase E1 component subunit alpha [Deinococcus radiophilus]UFA50192.1 thiamine pyrophosphate-dependent dehydrogenase E1 component subunit alpha [Deinococcus radiophilus]